MKRNMGSNDKLIRLGAAIVLIILFYKEVITGTLGIIALVVALILTITSLIGFCPLYALFGIKTCRSNKQQVFLYLQNGSYQRTNNWLKSEFYFMTKKKYLYKFILIVCFQALSDSLPSLPYNQKKTVINRYLILSIGQNFVLLWRF